MCLYRNVRNRDPSLVETKMAYKCHRVVIGRISCNGPWRLRDNAITISRATDPFRVNGDGGGLGLGSVNDSLNGEECREEIH